MQLQWLLAASYLLFGIASAVRSSGTSSSSSAGKNTPDGTCGSKNGYTCLGSSDGDCCSQYNYCGKTSAYCGTGCQAAFGSCTRSSAAALSPARSSSHQASPTRISSIPAASSASTKPVSKNSRCGIGGSGQTCLGSTDGDCCSQYSYCGKTSAYCGVGCQKDFGSCTGGSSSSSVGWLTLSSSSKVASSSSSSIVSSAVSSIISSSSSSVLSSSSSWAVSSSSSGVSSSTAFSSVASSSSIASSSTIVSSSVSSSSSSSSSSSASSSISSTSSASTSSITSSATSSVTSSSSSIPASSSSSAAPVVTPACAQFQNSGFENPGIAGVTDWELYTSGQPVPCNTPPFDTNYFDPGDAVDGTHIGHTWTCDGVSFNVWGQDLTTSPGVSYTISFWILKNSNAESILSVDGVDILTVPVNSGVDDTMTQYSATFQAGALGISQVRIQDGCPGFAEPCGLGYDVFSITANGPVTCV